MKNSQRFNLVRWFAVSGLVAISLIGILSASAIANMLEKIILERDAQVMTEFVNSLIRRGEETNTQADQNILEKSGDLQVFFTQLLKIQGIMRANVYSPSNKIIWSSNPALINQQFSENHELNEALSGSPVSHIATVGKTNKDEHRFFIQPGTQFVEYYLPIWQSLTQQKNIIAVAEVYRHQLAFIQKLQQTRETVWASTIIGGLFLFISLFWIIKRAARIINTQEQRLIAIEKLAIFGELASSVAHGIRSPLSSIRSSAELALGNNNNDETNTSLKQIIWKTDTVETWIRQYLSEMQSEENPGYFTFLKSIINNSWQALRSHPMAGDINIDIDIEDDTQVAIHTVLLEQIITSLFSNALEAMPGHGTIHARAEITDQPSELKLIIRDDGSGMSPEVLSKIFQPLFTTKPDGLGIGMGLVKLIIERHSGSINIVSQHDEGTEVQLMLPQAI